MSIKPVCDRCGNELQAFGALAFSPPAPADSVPALVSKYHLCAERCWPWLIAEIEAGEVES